MLRGRVKRLVTRARRFVATPRSPIVSVEEAPAQLGLEKDGTSISPETAAVRLQSRWVPQYRDGDTGRVYIGPASVSEVFDNLRTLHGQPTQIDGSSTYTLGNIRIIEALGTWKRYPADCLVCGQQLRDNSSRKALVLVQGTTVTDTDSDLYTVGVHLNEADELADDIEAVVDANAATLLGDAL